MWLSLSPSSQLVVPLKDVLTHGKKVHRRALKQDARDYVLQKCPNMAKVDGVLRAAVSVVFAEEDSLLLQEVSVRSE